MPQCISPNTIRVGKSLITASCGKCNFCLQNRRCDWSFRLQQELKNSDSAWFFTMTYDQENQPLVEIDDQHYGTLDKRDLQLFFKRLRKANGKGKSIKYYAVGEYGSDTFRPHYHAIVFNVKPSALVKASRIWDKGFLSVGNCQPASIHYVAKYVLNSHDNWKPLANPFALISQGIGKSYLTTNGYQHKNSLQNFVVNDSGKKQRIPRYFKTKIFSRKQTESLTKTAIRENDLLYQASLSDLSNEYSSKSRELELRNINAHEKIKNKNPLQTNKL
ncbi:MAG: replication initiator protein [Microviridae sp.]|nr:MAG: replication initiator protein [Microviridae sp.]